MANDLQELRRVARGQSTTPRSREVSWKQHCEDHECTWDSFVFYITLAVLVCEAFLWFLLENYPAVVHQFFKLYDHKSFHSTEDLQLMTGALGAAFGGVLFIDNIWKVFTNDRRHELLY